MHVVVFLIPFFPLALSPSRIRAWPCTNGNKEFSSVQLLRSTILPHSKTCCTSATVGYNSSGTSEWYSPPAKSQL